MAVQESEHHAAGRDAMLAELAELMFAEVMRSHIENLWPMPRRWQAQRASSMATPSKSKIRRSDFGGSMPLRWRNVVPKTARCIRAAWIRHERWQSRLDASR